MKNALRVVGKIAPVFDFVFTPLSLLAVVWLRVAKFWGIKKMPVLRRILLKVGVLPVVDHYYEPLFDARRIPSSAYVRPNNIDLQMDGQLKRLAEFNFQKELGTFPLKAKEGVFHYENGSFGAGDAELYYSIIRSLKPSRILEVGGGYSTLIARLAINANKEENPSHSCMLTCVEPFEQPWLSAYDIDLIRRRVEDLEFDHFNALKENDILFIDSSHVFRLGGDLDYLYLRILPALSAGVWIHIHDIFYPQGYPERWLRDEFRLWNEQYFLEAFMVNNDYFEVCFAMNALMISHFESLKKRFPVIANNPKANPGSFWVRKVK